MNKKHPNFAHAMCAVALQLFLFPTFTAAQGKPDIFVQLGHSYLVNAVAFAPDGRTVVSGSEDSTLKLWDATNGRELRTFSGHTSSVNAVAFSPDGRTLVSGSWDKTLKLWNVMSGRELRTFSGHTSSVNAVAFSPDGRTLVSGGKDKNIKLWNVANGRVLRTLGGHGDEVRAVTFSPDGRTLVSGGEDKTLKLWDVATGKELRTLSGHGDEVRAVAFSPDGRTLVSGSEDGTLKLWDTASGQELRTLPLRTFFKGNMLWINAVAFSPDGRTLVSGGEDKTLKLWDVATGKELRTLSGHGDEVRAVAFSPDGRTLVSGGKDKTVRLWDVESGREAHVLSGYTSPVHTVAFSSDGHTLASGSGDETIKLWDVATGKGFRALSGHTKRVGAVAFSPDGRTLVSGSYDKTLKLWDVATGKELRTLSGHTGWISAAAFSPDGRTVVSGSLKYVSGSNDTVIKLWDVASGRELRTLSGHGDAVYAVAFSPDGRTIASGSGNILNSADKTIKLWDAASGRELRTLSGHGSFVHAVAFAPDGRTFASGSVDKTIKLWDMASGRELRTLGGHGSLVTAVAFASDGRTIVSGGQDSTVRLWDAATGSERAMLVSFKGGEWIAMTPEGYYTGSEKADQYVNVRIGNKVYGVDQYREKFYRPEVVMAALAGKPITGLASLGSVKPAPSVSIVETPASVSSDEATVKVKVADAGGGVGDVRVYLNGSAVSLERRNLAVAAVQGKAQVFSYKVKLVSGKNAIRAIAFNAENSMQSTDALHVIEASIAATKPSLYAVVVGIQEYVNPKLTLKYSVADANLFADTIKAKAGGLFEKVEITRLVTAKDTTNAAIAAALKTARAKVRPDDLFVFYVASHGTVDEGEYYLVTSNVGSTSTEKLKRDALSQNSLKELIANIPATKKLIVLDTCNAGKLGDSLQVALLTRGMNEDTAFKILSRAVGSTILSAATSQQEALEGYQNHGLFTWVLAEGLNGAADLDKDGFIKTIELASYVDEKVPELAEKVFRHKQFPVVAPSGQAFPIVRVR